MLPATLLIAFDAAFALMSMPRPRCLIFDYAAMFTPLFRRYFYCYAARCHMVALPSRFRCRFEAAIDFTAVDAAYAIAMMFATPAPRLPRFFSRFDYAAISYATSAVFAMILLITLMSMPRCAAVAPISPYAVSPHYFSLPAIFFADI